MCLTVEASHAWRETGHFAVCEIAYRNLTSEAREQVDAILGGKDFATQCTWPDMVRKSPRWGHTYDWHFINLDDGKEYFAEGNISPKGDVLQALLLAEAKLLDEATPQTERRIFLRFLGHFAGDSHMPLHAGRKADLGGNLLTASWFGDDTFESTAIELAPVDNDNCMGEDVSIDPATSECVKREVSQRPVNLHKIWDLLIIQRFIDKQRLRAEAGDSEFLHKAYATAVEGVLDGEAIARANRGTFWDWTEESLRDRGRAYAIGRGKLKRRYYRRNVGYLNRRIASAGHRLAFTLNRIFASTKTPETAEIEAKHRQLRARVAELAGDGSPLIGL